MNTKIKTKKKLQINLTDDQKSYINNSIRGNYNEILAFKYYYDLGYTVIKLGFSKPIIGNYNSLPASFTYKNDEEWDIIDFWDKKLLNYLKKTIVNGLPDFVCVKNGEIIFVECKCDAYALSDDQKKKFKELKEMGYEVFIFTTKIKPFDIEHKESSIKVLIKQR
jgi:hypothetical protein